MRVQEGGQGGCREGGPDRFEGGVVEAGGEARCAENHAANVGVRREPSDLRDDVGRVGGERKRGEGVEAGFCFSFSMRRGRGR